MQVLAEAGYAHASLARIAKHAGISKGVISYHFAGKDELMRQVVHQLFVSGAEFMEPIVDAAEGPHNRLRAYIESNLSFIAANTTFIAAMMEVVLNLRNADGTLTFARTGGEDEMLAPLASMLAEGQKAGEFGDFDPKIMAKLIRDSIDGIAGRAIREPNFDVQTYTVALTQLYALNSTGTHSR